MCSIPASTQATIITMLSNGKSYSHIHAATGISKSTISKVCSQFLPTLTHTSGGHPQKLTPANIHHACYLIVSGKAETAVDVTKALNAVRDTPVSAESTRRGMKKGGMRAVVKKKPSLFQRHKKARL